MAMTRVATSNLTSYDFLKFAAIVLMVIDHTGHFFYPDDMWFRAIGRLSAPIWLFLIGYARSRDLPWQMWAGALFLMGINFVVGQALLPVYILGSMLLFRMILDPVMGAIKRDPKSLYPVTLVVFFLTLITAQLFEYGAAGFILVMAGYICRNRDEMGFDRARVLVFLIAAAVAHYLANTIFYFPGFSIEQKIFTGAALVFLMMGLGAFAPREYPRLTQNLPRPLVWLVQLGGRWSLELYVFHLTLFMLIALYRGAPGYAFFDFKLW